MLKAIDEKGFTVYPEEKGLRAWCPGCKGEVISVCPELNIVKHWRHKNGKECDSWYNPHDSLSPWHRSWQSLVNPENYEVVIGEHRADIRGNNGIVIEIQHSTEISVNDIHARETYYDNMIWVIDSQTFFDGKKYYCHVPEGKNEILYNIKKLKKIKEFNKPVYVHLNCGAIANITSINEDTVTMKIVYWKDFVDIYLSEVLSIEYPSICPSGADICQINDSKGIKYKYPDCQFQMYFKLLRNEEECRQHVIKREQYLIAGLSNFINDDFVFGAEDQWKNDSIRLNKLKYEDVMNFHSDSRTYFINNLGLIQNEINERILEYENNIKLIEQIEARFNAYRLNINECSPAIWDISKNENDDFFDKIPLNFHDDKFSQDYKISFVTYNFPKSKHSEEIMRIYISMKSACVNNPFIDTEALKNRLNNSREYDQMEYTNASLLTYLEEMEKMGIIKKTKRKGYYDNIYYDWSPIIIDNKQIFRD